MGMTIKMLAEAISSINSVSELLNSSNVNTITKSIEDIEQNPLKKVKLMAAIKQLKLTARMLGEQQVKFTDKQ